MGGQASFSVIGQMLYGPQIVASCAQAEVICKLCSHDSRSCRTCESWSEIVRKNEGLTNILVGVHHVF